MAYGIKYTSEFSSELGINYKVRILQKDYASAVTDLVMGGEPVIINYNGGENKFETIRGSECAISFYAKYNYQFTEIVKANKNDFKIEILKNGALYWSGYVIQDNYNEPFMPLPYLVTIRATDGLGDLKFLDFKPSIGSLYLNKMTQIEAILACLSRLRNGTQLVSSIDLYESRIDKNNASNEALNRVFVNPFVYLKNDTDVNNCSEVLKSILEIYNAYIYYKEGTYFIERVNYKLQSNLIRRTYNISFDSASSTSNAVTTSNITSTIGRNSALRFVNNDANFTYQTPFKSLTVNNECNVADELLLNSKFTEWDSGTPKFWVNNGLSVAKTGNTRSDSILQINTRNDNDGSINANSPNLSFLVNNFNSFIGNVDTIKLRIGHSANLRIAIKITSPTNTSWLYKNADGSYQWSNSFNYIKVQAPDGSYPAIYRRIGGNWRQDYFFVDEINVIPIYDATYTSMQVYIFAPFNNSAGLRNDDMVLREFSIKYDYKNSSKYTGEKYKLISDLNHLDPYTEFEPLFGEFKSIGYTNQLMLNTSTGYTYTQNWAREGKNESKPLLEIASKSILNQYREPFKNFSTSVKGEFDFGKIYNIDNLTGKYMPFKAQLSLKNDTSNVELFELLNEDNEGLFSYTKTIMMGDDNYNIATYTKPVYTGWRAARG